MSEKLITCNYQGRLGNLLFEVAATLAAGWDNGLTPSFSYQYHDYYKDIPAFTEYLLPIISHFHRHDESFPFQEYHEPADLAYKPIVVSENTKLHGYFTSSLYFNKYRQRIIDHFRIHDHQVNQLYENIVAISPPGSYYVSVHVRRQDYVTDYNAALPISYYEQAAREFDENVIFCIFSDDKKWCVHNLPFMKNKIFILEEKDYLELQLMGKMDAHISANSTFSAMGIILGDPDSCKTVYAPKNWWPTHFNPNIYEPHWIKI